MPTILSKVHFIIVNNGKNVPKYGNFFEKLKKNQKGALVKSFQKRFCGICKGDPLITPKNFSHGFPSTAMLHKGEP